MSNEVKEVAALAAAWFGLMAAIAVVVLTIGGAV